MKKLVSLLIICLFTWSMAGCQTQMPPSSGETSFPDSSTSLEEDPVVICIDESLKQDMEELIRYLEASGNKTEYVLLVLPEGTEDRDPELTRIRTEIMAGEGPDAFVLNSSHPRLFLDQQTMEPLEPLFPNVEKSMYSHLFLDLDEMARNSEIVDLENCNQTVMNAGVTEDGRFLLPIAYTFSTVMVDQSALEDPNYTFSTLDQLLQSDQESLKGFFSYKTLALFPDCMGTLADYMGQNLLVTTESLANTMEQVETLTALRDEKYSGSNAVMGGVDASATVWMDLPKDELVYAVFPVPNQEGGVTAGVTQYAAINQNTNHPQEAFTFIEQLFHEELATGGSLVVNDYNYYPFHFDSDLPVKEQVLLDYIEPNTQAGTIASLQTAVARIDSAKVYSNLDLDIYELYETWHFSHGQLDTPLEELVEQTISSMEMTLAE